MYQSVVFSCVNVISDEAFQKLSLALLLIAKYHYFILANQPIKQEFTVLFVWSFYKEKRAIFMKYFLTNSGSF